ncbi:MAG: TIGR03086 family metal-binding protein [Actinomycetota bacterium]
MHEIDGLERGFENTARILRGVRDDQWDASTPCSEWDVRALANHVTWAVGLFAAAVEERAPSSPPDADVLGDDPVGAFEAAAAAAVTAWRERGHLDGEVRVGETTFPARAAIGVNHLDAYVHGWDLAVATGQDPRLDDDLCAPVLAVAEELVPPTPRGDNFGPVVDAGAGASTATKMLGYLGRRPV